eukprot:m.57107 g.57107  ORF g.57107 m.57107 type:complete len:191 (+) comp13436_c0_seq4:51-623(+)
MAASRQKRKEGEAEGCDETEACDNSAAASSRKSSRTEHGDEPSSSTSTAASHAESQKLAATAVAPENNNSSSSSNGDTASKQSVGISKEANGHQDQGADSSSNSSERVEVKVLFFARAREALGLSSSTMALPSSISGAGLVDILMAAYPALNELANTMLLALNESYVERTDSLTLRRGDEVAVIPPLSGG